MAKRLFVGGLPFSVTDSQLHDMFVQFGTVVSASVIMDKFSGRSKGFGFVDMQNDDESDAAIKKLDGSEVDGRKIVVNVARPREERPRFENKGNFRRDDRRPDNRKRF